MLPKSLSDRDAIVDGTDIKWSHQTKTFIHFSVKLWPEKLNKYHLVVHNIQEYFIDIHKNVITVITPKTKVVFKSLFIGLTYSNILGEIDVQAQSIINQNKFQNKMIIKNQATRGKNALENFLSHIDSDIFLSSNHTKSKIAAFNLELSFFIASLANTENITTNIKKINVAILVLLTGP